MIADLLHQKVNKNKPIRNNVQVIFIILLLIMYGMPAVAADWFVRPKGSGIVTKNGRSYETAWEGFDTIVWGENGVKGGDTLWVCGLHGNYGSGSVYTQTAIMVGASGTESQPIIIRGDAKVLNSSYENGIIYRTNRRYPAGTTWSDTGINGVYYCNNLGSVSWLYENLIFMIKLENCSKPPTQEELENFQPGSFFMDNTNAKLYVKPLNGNHPSQNTYLTVISSPAIDLTNRSNIYVKNILCRIGGIKLYNSQNILIEGVSLYDQYKAITLEAGSHNAVIRGCTIDRSGEGIYSIAGNGISNNLLVENCVIKNIKNEKVGAGAPDCHAIAFQGGTGLIVRNNYVDTAATAVTLYSGYTGDTDIEIYNNFAINMWRHGPSNNPWAKHGAAYDFHASTNFIGKLTFKAYNNIAVNATNSGIRVGWSPNGSMHDIGIFNNVIYKCSIGIAIGGANTATRKYIIKNNIIHTPYDHGTGVPVVYMWYYQNAGANNLSEIDYNCYYPDPRSDGKFFWTVGGGYAAPLVTYSQWKSFNPNGTDAHSVISDPKFVNTSRSFSVATDFKLADNSPARAAG